MHDDIIAAVLRFETEIRKTPRTIEILIGHGMHYKVKFLISGKTCSFDKFAIPGEPSDFLIVFALRVIDQLITLIGLVVYGFDAINIPLESDCRVWFSF